VTTTGSPYFIWEAKDKAVSVLLDLDLVTHLDRTVVEAFFRSRQEVEGLLLGHVEQATGRGQPSLSMLLNCKSAEPCDCGRRPILT